MMTIEELFALPSLIDRPERSTQNVAPITVGDLRVLRGIAKAWEDVTPDVDWPAVRRRLPLYCAVCKATFDGERCPTCGLERR